MPKLEMLRVANNSIKHVPQSLGTSKSLKWFSFAGNPGEGQLSPAPEPPKVVTKKQLNLGATVGSGASG